MSGYPKPRQNVRKRVLMGVRSEHTGFKIDGVPDACWRWQGEKDRNGYGRIKRDGVRVPTHWILIGDPPDGFEVDHLCETRDCVKPSHLEYVTHIENNRRKGKH